MVAMQIQATDTGNAPLFYSESGLPSGLYINPSTGFIFGTISSSATTGSPYSVTITATDPASNTASQTFSWTISAAGTVTVTNPGDQTNKEGDSVSLAVTSNDTGSGTMHYVAFGLPAGLAISTSTGAISGTVAIGAAANGPYTVTIVANDGTYSAAQTFNWMINSPIALTAPADQTNNEADTVSLSLTAADSVSGSTLSYSALGLPPGLKINASTGAITGTVAKGAAANGPYSVTVIAEDGTYSSSQTFNWNVNSPITITVPDDQTNNDGNTVSLTLSAADSISGTTLVYSVQGLPPGLSINASTGAITGTHELGDSTIGSYFPTIIVGDGTYYSSAGFEWDVNGAIAITDPGAQANVVGDAVSLPVAAADTDSGTLTYAATGLPNGLSINTSTGLISGTVGTTAIGSFTTTVTVGDGTNTAVDTFAWTITGTSTVTLTTPSSQTTTEGTTISTLSLSATDSGSGTLKYFAVGLPFGLKINPGTGAITGTVAVNDAAYGPHSVTVIATDGTYSAAETFTWTVDSPVTFSSIADQTNDEGDTVSVSAGATDSVSGSTLKYGAIGLPDGLKISTSTGAITGTLAPGTAATGSFTVTVLAGDGTYSSSQMITWGATNPITLTTPTDQTNNEGDTASLSLSATDSVSGSTLSYAAVGLPPGLKINPSTGAITGIVAIGTATLGTYTVLVAAGDGSYSTNTTFSWTVSSPIVIAPIAAMDLTEGISSSEDVNASDASGGTKTFSASGLPLGMIINALTGVISGTVSNSIVAAGRFIATIYVTDGTNSADQTIVGEVEPSDDGPETYVLYENSAADEPKKDDPKGETEKIDARIKELIPKKVAIPTDPRTEAGYNDKTIVEPKVTELSKEQYTKVDERLTKPDPIIKGEKGGVDYRMYNPTVDGHEFRGNFNCMAYMTWLVSGSDAGFADPKGPFANEPKGWTTGDLDPLDAILKKEQYGGFTRVQTLPKIDLTTLKAGIVRVFVYGKAKDGKITNIIHVAVQGSDGWVYSKTGAGYVVAVKDPSQLATEAYGSVVAIYEIKK